MGESEKKIQETGSLDRETKGARQMPGPPA